MVDFAKIRADRAARLATDPPKASETKPPVAPKPRAVGRDNEEDMANINMLLNECEITPWETTFCKSIKGQMLSGYGALQPLSIKQAAILDKIVDEHIEVTFRLADPTPQGNPPAQFARPVQQRGVNKPHLHFDDMDDDIPF